MSKARRRRMVIVASFLICVIMPLLLTAGYLFFIASDQYSSKAGFVVRKSDKTFTSAFDLLGGISSLSSASSTESVILYEFIRSRNMVELIDAKLDLRAMYSRPAYDPIFAFDASGSIEQLEKYWARMVQPHFDSASGLLELRVLAFAPDDATRIAREIVRQSSLKINNMSSVARGDRTQYSREDLEKAVDFLKLARKSMTEFRSRNRIVDPKADIQVQMGLISTLHEQLANAMIELDMLKLTTRNEDPRINQVEQRISVIQNRVDAERGRFGVSDGGVGGNEAFSQIIEEFESLSVDLEFAERAYVAALATYDEALAEANRQSLYLATYIEPTKAEMSEYPRRWVLISMLALFLGLMWTIGSLILYSVWDRR